jgi:hypothetical protein
MMEEAEVREKAQAIVDGGSWCPPFAAAAEAYNRAVWAGDEATAQDWRRVFGMVVEIWIEQRGKVDDIDTYYFMCQCSFYWTGFSETSPEERAWEQELFSKMIERAEEENRARG